MTSNCQFVSPDLNSFWERAVHHLASRGCKRVAVIMPRGVVGMMELTPKQYIQRAGMATESCWVHGLHFGAPEVARGLVHKAMTPINTINAVSSGPGNLWYKSGSGISGAANYFPAAQANMLGAYGLT